MKKSKLASAFEKWQSKLPRRRKEGFRTDSSIELPDLNLPQDNWATEEWYRTQLGFPGEFPFTRGVYPTMYRGQLWTMRQYAGFGTAAETNKRYQYLLSQGTTGLSVAFDLPTQMGRDSDHALAKSEVGRVGVAIDTVDDMERLFQSIPLEQVSVSMTINATAHILLAFYLVLAEKQGVSWERLRGTVQNDVLKEYIARGTYIYPPGPGLRIVTDIFEFCSEHVPSWNTISISGYHIREAGSTAAQEIAFTLADGIAYVSAAVERGLKVDSFAPRLAFFFNCHNNFLEEVAKFRAARRMWARIMKQRFGAKEPRSLMLRFHTQTAGSTLTAQQPQVNLVRTTVQALAAVLGGTQSLHTNGYDEALGLPTEESALLALRTQQVIANESGVADFVDPLGGSFAIEQLTDALEEKAEEIMAQIEELGGMVAAIDAGYPQGEIERAAYEYQRSLESGERPVVGVNVFTEDEGNTAVPVTRLDPALEQDQCKRLAEVKARRDNQAVSEVLAAIGEAARSGSNLMPAVLRAARAYATLGEISDVLRGEFGQYRHTR